MHLQIMPPPIHPMRDDFVRYNPKPEYVFKSPEELFHWILEKENREADASKKKKGNTEKGSPVPVRDARTGTVYSGEGMYGEFSETSSSGKKTLGSTLGRPKHSDSLRPASSRDSSNWREIFPPKI